MWRRRRRSRRRCRIRLGLAGSMGRWCFGGGLSGDLFGSLSLSHEFQDFFVFRNATYFHKPLLRMNNCVRLWTCRCTADRVSRGYYDDPGKSGHEDQECQNVKCRSQSRPDAGGHLIDQLVAPVLVHPHGNDIRISGAEPFGGDPAATYVGCKDQDHKENQPSRKLPRHEYDTYYIQYIDRRHGDCRSDIVLPNPDSAEEVKNGEKNT